METVTLKTGLENIWPAFIYGVSRASSEASHKVDVKLHEPPKQSLIIINDLCEGALVIHHVMMIFPKLK